MEEGKDLVTPGVGLLIIDDNTLDKPYSKHIDLVYRQGVVNIIKL
jgi:hypothetical protein